MYDTNRNEATVTLALPRVSLDTAASQKTAEPYIKSAQICQFRRFLREAARVLLMNFDDSLANAGLRCAPAVALHFVCTLMQLAVAIRRARALGGGIVN